MMRTVQRVAHKTVLTKWRVEGSEKQALLIKLFGPVPTLGIKYGDVRTIPEAVLSILPRCSVMNVADQVLSQNSWVMQGTDVGFHFS